jgi:hypothetical protein
MTLLEIIWFMALPIAVLALTLVVYWWVGRGDR